jgi:predicted amidophosphoribosyltransferase
MLSSVFQTVCIGCGELCAFDDILCKKCTSSMKVIKTRCSNCGHPLNISASYCRHCAERAVDHYYADYSFEGFARKMIINIKYGWRLRGGSQIGRLCSCFGVDFGRYDAACVVPSHFLRNFMRYIHPVRQMQKVLQNKLNFEKLLKRTRYTAYQAKLSRSGRLKNIRGAFETRGGVEGKKILLIDDILTTGSTLREAAKTLKRSGADMVDVYTLFARVYS